MEGARFDPDLLDPEEPFEFDPINLPHLFKHGGFGITDIYDVYYGDPLFYEASRPADWLMIGEVPGDVLRVPLMPSSSGNASQCRPIGVYPASRAQRVRYYIDLG